MADYIVVSYEFRNKEYEVDAGIEDFTKLVNEKLNEGYTCVGGVSKEEIIKTEVTDEYDNKAKMSFPISYKINFTVFHQALVKTAPQAVGGERRQRKTLRKRK